MLRTRDAFGSVAPLLTVCAALALSTPAFAQSLGGAPDDDISLWRVGFALVLCLGLAVAGAYALKARMGGEGGAASLLAFAGKRERRLRHVETLRLGVKSTLSLVTCDGKEILVLTSEHGAQVIDTAGRSLLVKAESCA